MLDSRIEIVLGDITRQRVDAIVNAANASLLGGGGVDGAIHRAAGPGLLAECRELRGCPTGGARITGGHHLKARQVIHAVGPIWQGGQSGEADLLTSCYRSALTLAVKYSCNTVAFPAISCGVFGYPWDAAARVAFTAAHGHLETDNSIGCVRWVLFGEEIFRTWQNVLSDLRA